MWVLIEKASFVTVFWQNQGREAFCCSIHFQVKNGGVGGGGGSPPMSTWRGMMGNHRKKALGAREPPASVIKDVAPAKQWEQGGKEKCILGKLSVQRSKGHCLERPGRLFE